MNGLDVFFIILTIIIVGCAFWGFFSEISWDFGFALFLLISVLGCACLTGLLPFLVIDKSSGVTVGTITSVDKNFFGTTALWIKTIENEQEKYCIEFDEELEKQAKELVGEEVKITYGTRVGMYSTTKCHQAPIDKIKKVKQP